jgi:hypothetical protein
VPSREMLGWEHSPRKFGKFFSNSQIIIFKISDQSEKRQSRRQRRRPQSSTSADRGETIGEQRQRWFSASTKTATTIPYIQQQTFETSLMTTTTKSSSERAEEIEKVSEFFFDNFNVFYSNN